jgi:hypothetical protein
VREEQIVALTLIGLIVWNLSLYMVSFPTTTTPIKTATATPPPASGQQSWMTTLVNLLSPITCAYMGLFHATPPSCNSNQTSTSQNATAPQKPLTPNPFFFPVLIFALTSYGNAFWIMIGFASLRSHGRYEVEDSMTIAAVQAMVPPILPIIIMIQLFSSKIPIARTTTSKADEMMEA